jgi:hypothetical protein
MKNTLFVLCLFLTNVLFAQEDYGQKIAYKLLEYSQKNPTKKIFLHLDDTQYQAGEAIFFKAQSVDGIKHLPDTASTDLFCELRNEKTGRVVLRKNFDLKRGVSEGYLQISDTIATGNYTLKAYTSAMQPKDEAFYFYQNLKINNPKKGVFQAVETSDFELQFFPESGQIVQDVQMKIAFKMELKNQQDIDFQGFILGEKGDTVTTFASEKFGMGFFRLKAKANEKYKALVSINGQTKYFSLPKTEPYGHVLSMDNLTSAETIGVNIKSKVPESELNKPMMVIAQSRGNFLFLGRFTTSNQKTVLAIPKAMFPDGIIQFTIFDEKGTPFSERIIYNNAPNLLNISLIVKEKDTLLVNVNDRDGRPLNATLSLAVRDSAAISADISKSKVNVFLPLVSDLKNKIASPEYYFDRSNKNAQKDLDILMMTQKWERFTWKDILKDKIVAQNTVGKSTQIAQNEAQYLAQKSKIILWQPTIEVKNGVAKIVLPQVKKGTTLHFFAQGISPKGMIGSEEVFHKID